MLNWLCVYSVPWVIIEGQHERKHIIKATLIASDPRQALKRLREDDRYWRDGVLVNARPVMQAPTPPGAIDFKVGSANGI